MNMLRILCKNPQLFSKKCILKNVGEWNCIIVAPESWEGSPLESLVYSDSFLVFFHFGFREANAHTLIKCLLRSPLLCTFQAACGVESGGDWALCVQSGHLSPEPIKSGLTHSHKGKSLAGSISFDIDFATIVPGIAWENLFPYV